jgi:hypothetical protein
MEIKILNESGIEEALLGLSLSYSTEKNINELYNIALKLSNKDSGHNKFLESIVVWLDIKAPRYWWSQFDTYRTGITKQSESTMHTITRRHLKQDDFEYEISEQNLNLLNGLIDAAKRDKMYFERLKNELPEGFLQRRIVCLNYKAIRNIILQRKNHKLKEWEYFCVTMTDLKTFALLGLLGGSK